MAEHTEIDLNEAVVIALGSNLPGGFDSSRALLEEAVVALESAGLAILARSSWWRSAAWPDPAAPSYLNGVVLTRTALSPSATLARLHALERRFGRERGAVNASRTLDLDLIAHGRFVSSQACLAVPHPRAHERLFVMGPLAEIAPAWRHPLTGQTAEDLASKAVVGQDATRLR